MPALIELDGCRQELRRRPAWPSPGGAALHPLTSAMSEDAARRSIAVVGESGSGKTTLGNILLGLLASGQSASFAGAAATSQAVRRAETGARSAAMCRRSRRTRSPPTIRSIRSIMPPDGADPQFWPGKQPRSSTRSWPRRRMHQSGPESRMTRWAAIRTNSAVGNGSG